VLQNILKQFDAPPSNPPLNLSTLRPEDLDIVQVPEYRKIVVDRWNNGSCKILVVNREVEESKLWGKQYIQFYSKKLNRNLYVLLFFVNREKFTACK
jgi:hypothetical protein